MKKIIKQILPNVLKKKIGEYFKRPIYNVFNTSFKKKVLISYITGPFRKNSLSHTNYFEAQSAAKIFHELGYQVDVIHYELSKKVSIKKYTIVYGFGDVFRNVFETPSSKVITIYYAAGMHVCWQNNATLQRVKDVHDKKKVWLGQSARFVEKTWTHQTCLVDAIIALGNRLCKESYQKYYQGKVYSLPAPFYQVLNPVDILSNRKIEANKNFLWFGSGGLIHKGLDICLDFFKTRPDLQLHICGNIHSEPDFIECYHHDLFELSNIYCHGFVDISTSKFINIIESCSFAVLPSCSEGGSPSILTTVGNGALIPIISKETTVSTGYEIFIESLSVRGLKKSIEYAETLTNKEIKELQIKNYKYVEKENSKNNYYNNLKSSIKEIIDTHEM